MSNTPDAWDARNTLHAMKLWATGIIGLGQFIELCKEIYLPYMLEEQDDEDQSGD